jgi:Ser/Thr protein kinase RdoA (MazF antagonist)
MQLENIATATAHGMSKARVQPDWPALALDDVRPLLRDFNGCGEPIAILSASPRPFSAASVVSTSAGRIFVKRHHRSVRDGEGLFEEHRFLTHLHSHGAPVPRIFANKAGETAIEMDDWTYEVHEAPAGVDIYEDALSWTPFLTCAHAYSAGQALARLHCAAESFLAPPRPPRPLVASFAIFAANDPAAALKNYLQARPALAEDVFTHRCGAEALALLEPFHAQLQPLLPQLAPLWTHNDLHASNILWSDAGPSAQAQTIIDFGLADRTTAVHDLAHAIERNIVEWLEIDEDSARIDNVPIHIDHLFALLDGYVSRRPLSDAELAALAPVAALCHAEFALTEADYFLGVLHSQENHRVCVEDYLVGRARWMCGPGGDKLLQAIARWAESHLQTSQESTGAQ